MRAPRSVFFLRKEEGVSLCGGQGAGISKWRVHLLSAVHGGGTTSSSRATSTSRGRPKASPPQVRPASPPTPPTDSRWRVDAPPASERLAPAAALTLHRTPNGASGSCSSSPWVQKAYLAARFGSPPLPSRKLPQDASARRRRSPLVPAVSLPDPARMSALLRHPEHPWDREPPSVHALSGCMRPERANCQTLYRILHVHEIRGTNPPFFLYFLSD